MSKEFEEFTSDLQMLQQGSLLSELDVVQLEAEMVKFPTDMQLKTKILGHYLAHPRISLTKYVALYLWSVENHPESNFTNLACQASVSLRYLDANEYAIARDKWIALMDAPLSGPGVFSNASSFFARNQDWHLAEIAALNGRKLQPEEDIWLYRLAEIAEFKNDSVSFDDSMSLWKLLSERENNHVTKMIALTRLVCLSVLAEKWDTAFDEARELVFYAETHPDDFISGYALHIGHLAAGKVALERKNLSESIDRLVAASLVPNSIQYYNQGPDINLAMELLALGEKSAVLNFLTNCTKLDCNQNIVQKLHQWTCSVERNGRF